MVYVTSIAVTFALLVQEMVASVPDTSNAVFDVIVLLSYLRVPPEMVNLIEVNVALLDAETIKLPPV